jgi:hypothetical protein
MEESSTYGMASGLISGNAISIVQFQTPINAYSVRIHEETGQVVHKTHRETER